MCGIFAVLGQNILDQRTLDLLKSAIANRGPDYSSQVVEHRTKCGLGLKLMSSVLHLSGEQIEKQPVIDGVHNDVFMFNGHVYNYDGQPLPNGVSDTRYLKSKITHLGSKREIVEVFSMIDGPYAFLYWNDHLSTLFYGRDLFGRKSLCVLRDSLTGEPKVISSVAPFNIDGYSWHEVDCSSLHCIDYSNQDKPDYSLFKWNLDDIYSRTSKCQTSDYNQEYLIGEIKSTRLSPLNYDFKLASDFSDSESKQAVNVLGQKLIAAVSKRIRYTFKKCLLCRKNVGSPTCEHSKCAVAFSGGIDSTMLVLALDNVLDAQEVIDLITVAFKDESPDRSSVASAFDELRQIRPKRNFRLVICDIDLDELISKRQTQIKHLIAPCCSVIDDSLGCACWFIGRAEGRSLASLDIDQNFIESGHLSEFLRFTLESQITDRNSKVDYNYKSPASILIVGSSIDEQLGGYSSHRSAWATLGAKGLLDEISFQMRRLSTRNLGRDDRCYADHGRELKLPYLDFELVSYLNELPIGLKMDLTKSNDVGPKKILRELARDWGLNETSRRVKRAMQFGTRIAKCESTKEKGNDVCSRLNS